VEVHGWSCFVKANHNFLISEGLPTEIEFSITLTESKNTFIIHANLTYGRCHLTVLWLFYVFLLSVNVARNTWLVIHGLWQNMVCSNTCMVTWFVAIHDNTRNTWFVARNTWLVKGNQQMKHLV